jgi:hypothetical protein
MGRTSFSCSNRISNHRTRTSTIREGCEPVIPVLEWPQGRLRSPVSVYELQPNFYGNKYITRTHKGKVK